MQGACINVDNLADVVDQFLITLVTWVRSSLLLKLFYSCCLWFGPGHCSFLQYIKCTDLNDWITWLTSSLRKRIWRKNEANVKHVGCACQLITMYFIDMIVHDSHPFRIDQWLNGKGNCFLIDWASEVHASMPFLICDITIHITR